MFPTGVFLATVIFVGLVIWLGGVVAGATRVRKTVRMRELPTHS
jgi:hypothetical protein